jgi:hypothetical protein
MDNRVDHLPAATASLNGELEYVAYEAIELVQFRRRLVTHDGVGPERQEADLKINPPRRWDARHQIRLRTTPLDDASLEEVVHLLVGHTQLLKLSRSKRSMLALRQLH